MITRGEDAKTVNGRVTASEAWWGLGHQQIHHPQQWRPGAIAMIRSIRIQPARSGA